MLTAITHVPSPHMNRCELTCLHRQPVDIARALRQHESYCDLLRSCSVQVITADQNRSFPDCAFVEDTALMLDETGVIFPMGVESRRKETEAIRNLLSGYRKMESIPLPSRIEGGDVLCIGKELFAGLSSRTEQNGIAALEGIVRPHGYKVTPVRVKNCLHLKTGCCALDEETLLINPAFFDPDAFPGFHRIAVPAEEPFAANVLRIGDTVCMHSGFTETRKLLEGAGFKIRETDISEFLKAEAGLTCMSLIFKQ